MKMINQSMEVPKLEVKPKVWFLDLNSTPFLEKRKLQQLTDNPKFQTKTVFFLKLHS